MSAIRSCTGAEQGAVCCRVTVAVHVVGLIPTGGRRPWVGLWSPFRPLPFMAVGLCFLDQCFSAQFLENARNFDLIHSLFRLVPHTPIEPTQRSNRCHTCGAPSVRRWTSGWKRPYHVLRWCATRVATDHNHSQDTRVFLFPWPVFESFDGAQRYRPLQLPRPVINQASKVEFFLRATVQNSRSSSRSSPPPMVYSMLSRRRSNSQHDPFTSRLLDNVLCISPSSKLL